MNLPCISYTASPPDSTVRGDTDVSIESCTVDPFAAVSTPVELDAGPGPAEAGPLAYTSLRPSVFSNSLVVLDSSGEGLLRR